MALPTMAPEIVLVSVKLNAPPDVLMIVYEKPLHSRGSGRLTLRAAVGVIFSMGGSLTRPLSPNNRASGCCFFMPSAIRIFNSEFDSPWIFFR